MLKFFSFACFLSPVIFISLLTPVFAQETDELIRLERIERLSPDALSQEPKNLARRNLGSNVYAVNPDGEAVSEEEGDDNGLGSVAAILLGDDEAAVFDLGTGRTQAIIELFDFFTVERALFRSYGAQGEVSIAASDRSLNANSGDWQVLLDPTAFDRNNSVNLPFEPVDAKFILVTLDVQTPGPVGALGVFGLPGLDSSTPEFLNNPEMIGELLALGSPPVPFDFASLYSGSNIIAVDSGDVRTANGMIDDDVTTFHEFVDAQFENIMVIDLGYDYSINRLSLVLESSPGSLEVYAFEALPPEIAEVEDDGEGLSSVVELDADFFDELTAEFVRFFYSDNERIQLSFPEITSRYIVIRWLGIESTVAKYPETEEPIRVWQSEKRALIAGVLNGSIAEEQLESWILDRDDPLQVLNGVFRVYEVSLIGDVPEELAFLDFTGPTTFLATEFDDSQNPISPEPDDIPDNADEVPVFSP